MAYSLNGLYQVGPGGSAPRLWMYSTADAIAAVIAADYFLGAIDVLEVNDVIIAVTSTGGTPAVTFTYVNANDGTTIDVVNGLVIPATDT
jgi:hypothetical protein